jgi:hypothetical protein
MQTFHPGPFRVILQLNLIIVAGEINDDRWDYDSDEQRTVFDRNRQQQKNVKKKKKKKTLPALDACGRSKKFLADI